MSKQSGDFIQILWPSQNILTLVHYLSYYVLLECVFLGMKDIGLMKEE